MDGAELRQIRRRLKMSQTRFGGKIGRSLRQIRDYERGDAKIALTVELAIKYVELRETASQDGTRRVAAGGSSGD